MPIRKILIASAAGEERRQLSDFLTRQGFEVHPAASDEEAMARAAALSPDLLLLDERLPGSGGLRVARALAQASSAACVTVFMLTGPQEMRSAAPDRGISGWLQRPVDTRELLRRIQECDA